VLLVRTRVDRSAIHGLGLFAAEHVPRGTRVWCFTPGFDLELDPAVLDEQPALLRERLEHYGYVDPQLSRYILCCDDARFINHSSNPNLTTDRSLGRHGVDVACRDIAPGDELTIDYLTIEGSRP
jgi:SET domain-containing protein